MKKIILLLFLITIQAKSQTNFTGAFDVSNWALSNTNADGNVNTTNAPTNIAITGGNNNSNTSGDTDFAILCPTAGTISFDWSYTTPDGAQFDYPSVTINGSKVFFNGYDINGSQNQSGLMTVNVNAGELFGFNIFTGDNIVGAATVTINNFNFSSIGTPTSKIRANQCGATLATLASNIAADYVSGYQSYRFEVSNGGTVNTVDVNKYNFNLTKTPGITYNTTYGIRVAVKYAGVWGPYGASCNITTPPADNITIPTTKIKPTLCGTTLATLDSKIAAIPVYIAEGYRFEITTGGVPTVYDSSLYNFKLSKTGVTVATNTVYSIRVAAKVNGVYGDYGTSCDVTTPGGLITVARIVGAAETVGFNLWAYPNPSNGAFKFQVNGGNKDAVSILVFDMTGRQIENKVVNANEIENISLGQNFVSGIYNVIVSQGSATKTLKVIKQ